MNESLPPVSGSGRRLWGRVFLYAFLSLHALVVAYPLSWLLTTSLKDSWSIFKSPWALPETMRWVNYLNAWVKGALGWKFWNSFVVDSIALVLILLIASMASYALARFRFRGNRFLYYLFVSGMALPVFLGIIPLFLLMRQLQIPAIPPLGWETHSLLDTRVGLILVYVAYSLAFTTFILYGFFRTLPGELAEAAAIDGCSPFGVFWKIMFPLARPGLVTAGIFVFIGLWNEYPLALVLLNSESIQTLPIGIANLTMSQQYQADWGALFAGLSIVVIPTICVYALFQKEIQAGLTAGAIKG